MANISKGRDAKHGFEEHNILQKEKMDKKRYKDAGKGDKWRGGWNQTYADNWDKIFGKKKICSLPNTIISEKILS